jgi:hypothetical protein
MQKYFTFFIRLKPTMDKAIIKVSKELRLDQLKLDNAVVIID